jgi:hypothetical protein
MSVIHRVEQSGPASLAGGVDLAHSRQNLNHIGAAILGGIHEGCPPPIVTSARIAA